MSDQIQKGWGAIWSSVGGELAPSDWYERLREEITKCRDAEIRCKMSEKALADGVERGDRIISLSLDLERELLGGLPTSKKLREEKTLRLQGMVGSLLALWEPEQVQKARTPQ